MDADLGTVIRMIKNDLCGLTRKPNTASRSRPSGEITGMDTELSSSETLPVGHQHIVKVRNFATADAIMNRKRPSRGVLSRASAGNRRFQANLPVNEQVSPLPREINDDPVVASLALSENTAADKNLKIRSQTRIRHDGFRPVPASAIISGHHGTEAATRCAFSLSGFFCFAAPEEQEPPWLLNANGGGNLHNFKAGAVIRG